MGELLDERARCVWANLDHQVSDRRMLDMMGIVASVVCHVRCVSSPKRMGNMRRSECLRATDLDAG